jgi:hypothetical protein
MLSSLFDIGSIEVMDDRSWMIIVKEFRVLLITQHLIRAILVETVLDVHARGVKIKSFLI